MTDPIQAERQRILSLLDSEEMVEKVARAARVAREGWIGREALGRTQGHDPHPNIHAIDLALARAALQSIREELAKS